MGRSSAVDAVVCEEDPYSTSIDVDLEETCWGCGLRVLVPPHASVFKCGWCGAITKQMTVNCNNKYLRWRGFRDRCFVCVVLVVMLLFICGGIWAVCPVVFSIGYFCGIFHFTLALILSTSTLSSFCLVAFRPAGVQQIIIWGSYPTVGKGRLENYTFCHYCSKPKSPRTHHCRSCGTCILDMDHHCPFIGNCVGASNHRCFILFLISAVTSTLYVTHDTVCYHLYLATCKSRNRQRIKWVVWYRVSFPSVKRACYSYLELCSVSTSSRTCSGLPIYLQCFSGDRPKCALVATVVLHLYRRDLLGSSSCRQRRNVK